jgi:RNA polymerase sigma factor (sigma-70 family)
MEINDDLIKQWEPKIVRMLSNTFVIGMDWDDLAQELRIAIMKAAHGFDEDRGVIFHTYLHTSMVNTLRTLISKAQRHQQPMSLDAVYYDDEQPLLDQLADSLTVGIDVDNDLELRELLDSLELTDEERQYILLRIEGLTMEEITEDLKSSAYKIKDNLKIRLEYLLDAGK